MVDGETGVDLESRAPQAWAEDITAIMSDPELARRLSPTGGERAEHLDWLRSGEGPLAVYDPLLRPGAAGAPAAERLWCTGAWLTWRARRRATTSG